MKLPPPINWLWSGWKAFSHAFGMVMSKIILTLLWIFGFGTYGIVMKVIALFTKTPPPPASYWLDTPPDFKDSMTRPF